ncbi:DUF459 domain-containing protein [Kiritimatiellaeota bacterium B1221]|nr:DUF459 domain-containing protein [Kiritimatiellaeota bacterium B1221]
MKNYFKIVLLSGLIGLGLHAGAADKPERVLIVGDSMMRVTAHALTLALDKHPEVTTKSQTSLGSGLARLDAYDWMEKIDGLVAEFNPDMSVVWFGTNDRQAMKTATGIVNIADPNWEDEYARRIGEVLDKLSSKGGKVIWLELPVMRDSDITANVDIVNRLAKIEADKRDAVTFFPTRNLLGRKKDTYSANIISPQGKMIQLRASDGVHLSRAGADRVAEAVDKALYK